MAELKHHTYETRDALAEGLASGIAAVLAGGIATRGRAWLAVSGGSTPKLVFRHLSACNIDWEKVTIILVDERIVPQDDQRSNARLVREHLLQGRASNAYFIPWITDLETREENAEASAPLLTVGDGCLDAVILGMGLDGHTASFFPGGDRLLSALDLEDRRNTIPIRAPNVPEDRLTLTLPYILDSRFLAIHIEGDEKRAVLDEAQSGTVRAVLRQSVAEVNLFWAP